KVMVYCASDFFILPSEQDNLPNTMLESLACGTPVAAFNVGGIPDCVKNMKTGVLSELGDYDSLTNGIKTIIDNRNLYKETRINCRKLIVDNFPLQLQASRYYKLYQELYQRP
ncbi:MAG TPA: glycosyltransferase, partial [Bacteroidetes bacterium]|nr:glycosyltransferase [Bacteroidota bacterium]